MGVRIPSVAVSGVGGALPGSAAETVIYTVGPLNEPIDGALVLLFWHYMINAGTGTVSVAFRLRRGVNVAAPALNINPNSIPLAAGANGIFAGHYVDNPGPAAALFYSLTIVQNGATAAGINADGALSALVL